VCWLRQSSCFPDSPEDGSGCRDCHAAIFGVSRIVGTRCRGLAAAVPTVHGHGNRRDSEQGVKRMPLGEEWAFPGNTLENEGRRLGRESEGSAVPPSSFGGWRRRAGWASQAVRARTGQRPTRNGSRAPEPAWAGLPVALAFPAIRVSSNDSLGQPEEDLSYPPRALCLGSIVPLRPAADDSRRTAFPGRQNKNAAEQAKCYDEAGRSEAKETGKKTEQKCSGLEGHRRRSLPK